GACRRPPLRRFFQAAAWPGVLTWTGKRMWSSRPLNAATRQGDFFEAVCFAKEKKLPMLFVVEDNAYGISSPTRKINPLALDVLQPKDWREVDGAKVDEVYDVAAEALTYIRAGKGPVFIWVMME